MPLAAMLKTCMSVYSHSIICRKLRHEDAADAVSGRTRANTPPGLSLRCPSAANADAIPAWP